MNLKNINGLGEKTIKHLNKKNINNIDDLVTFFPINYQSYTSTKLADKLNVQLQGMIIKNISEYKPRKNLLISTYYIVSNGTEYKIIAWNQKHLRFTLNVGDYVLIHGKYDAQKNQIVQSSLKKIDQDQINEEKFINSIIPIYSKINNISNIKLQKIILEAINSIDDPQYKKALINVHKPTNENQINNAIEFLKYKEFKDYYIKLKKLKKKKKNFDKTYEKYINENYYNKFLHELPFSLTEDQEKVVNNLIEDLKSDSLLQTLILGDVGSGKTIVSIIVSLLLVKEGYQVAVMAPTEVLAKQLYQNFTNYINDQKIELLTSSIPKSKKNKIKDNVLVGYTKILIGTHALIQDDVVFKNLALAIIDEQHRFGVNQRNALINKTIHGEFLYLSATPIPRTLAQSIFDVINVEFINSKPQNRKKIVTNIYSNKNKRLMFEILENELQAGNQAYIIAPTIEETEIENLENVKTLYESLTQYYNGKYNIGLLHGNMKSQDKDKIMENFKNKEYNILVATTVIEVGVDVENATVIMVVNAERYGLAQLHQLRGRVGRNDKQSYCLLFDKSNNKLSKERLNLLKEYDDGFILANKDLELRGGGNFFGKEQSGEVGFKLFNYYEDLALTQKIIEEVDNNESN